MKQPIILVGGGGHCKSSIDVIEQEGKYRIIGILDLPDMVGKRIMEYEIIGTDNDLPAFIKSVDNFLITIGQIRTSEKRIALWKMVKESGANLPAIVSPNSYVAKSAKIGEGSIIMHHAIINADASVGANCIINSKALIEHEVLIGDFCHISTGSVVNGQTKVGNRCFVGSNSTIYNNIRIVDDTIVSAGSIVLKDITTPGTYFGKSIR